jgi:hypothetical protein
MARGARASGTRASAKIPRNPILSPTVRTKTGMPAPTAYAAPITDTALALSVVVVTSGATTMATALVADSRGRASARIATNHQKPGDSAAAAVRASPIVVHQIMTLRRPCRSALPESGNAATEPNRMMPNPTPKVVPVSPGRACRSEDGDSPKPTATSASEAVAMNCANPAPAASPAGASTLGSNHRTSATRRPLELGGSLLLNGDDRDEAGNSDAGPRIQ